MSTADPSVPAASLDDVAEALAQAHDLRTLGTAFAKGLLANGKHKAAEVVQLMLGETEDPPDLGGEHAIITTSPPNPGGRDP